MLAAESYRMRLEKGLNFIEFNYMLLQAYDFLHQFRNWDCLMQMGGNDQWGNMVAGIDLIRRMEEKKTYSLTFPLITTSQGHKMGKTEQGTVWLDANLTSPYEYYQFWINTEDADVARFLSLFTFLPIEEIAAVKGLADARLNMAKTVLAFEATMITHGGEAALAAWKASAGAFGVKPVESGLFPSSAIPRSVAELDTGAMTSFQKDRDDLARGVPAFELFQEAGLCSSRGEARRLLSQGGGYVNERQITSFDEKITLADADAEGGIRLRKGKKHYVIVTVSSPLSPAL
jgi:tyrosyl-tRNA synthetase